MERARSRFQEQNGNTLIHQAGKCTLRASKIITPKTPAAQSGGARKKKKEVEGRTQWSLERPGHDGSRH